jgi:hypothetical protein
MKVTTVTAGRRKHYARLESTRTLCGLVGGVQALGIADCRRCGQILLGVSTSGPRM